MTADAKAIVRTRAALRRNPSRRRIAAIIAAALSAAVAAGCGAASAPRAPASGSAPTTVTRPASSPLTPVPAPDLLAKPLLNPSVTVTPAGLFVAWQVATSDNPGAGPAEIARIDPATGQVLASRKLGAAFYQAVQADGALWVATSTATRNTLVRLDPQTLKQTGSWPAGATARWVWSRDVLAVAGGGLWVAHGAKLLRLALPSGRVTATFTLTGIATSHVSANTSGTTLLVGAANQGGRGFVQRRDPVTGAVLASRPMLGVVAPQVAGPQSGSAWVSEPTGMLGYVQRLAQTTLNGTTCHEGTHQQNCATGTNGIEVRVADGLVWVTDPVGTPATNYCADPATGRDLAPIPLPRPGVSLVLAIGASKIYYSAPGPNGLEYVRTLPIPAACGVS